MSTRIARDSAIFEVDIPDSKTESAAFVAHWASGGMVYFPPEWGVDGDLTLEMLIREPASNPANWAEVKTEDGAADVTVNAVANAWVPIPAAGLLGHTIRFKRAATSLARTLVVALKG